MFGTKLIGKNIDDDTKYIDVTHYRVAEDGYWEDVWEIIDKPIEIYELYYQKHLEEHLTRAVVKFNNLKQKAQEIYASLTDESEKQAWDTYFSIMPTENPETHDITIPKFPIKNEEGKYVPNLDENGNWVTRVLHDGQ